MIRKSFWTIILLSCIVLFYTNSLQAQDTLKKVHTGFNLYNTKADAKADLNNAKAKALKEKKNILVFVGGNWCVWCKRLDQFLHSNEVYTSLLAEYVILHINYSKENKNETVLATLNNPQTQGFPVIVLLNNEGKYLITQNTGELESGSGYDSEKVKDFLTRWTYKYLNK